MVSLDGGRTSGDQSPNLFPVSQGMEYACLTYTYCEDKTTLTTDRRFAPFTARTPIPLTTLIRRTYSLFSII
jgi:hypothetical protein